MIFLAIILSYAGWAVAGNLTVVYKWKSLDYLWNSVEERQAAIGSGKYIPENLFSIDVDVYKDKVWVTTPKYMGGVPATLSLVSNETGPGGHLLKPYPDWSWHTRTDCKGITNVWRVAIDDCNRLWVLDSGVVGTKRVCPASLILFDAKTDELLERFNIPDELLDSSTANSSLVTAVVETNGLACRDTWVYIADMHGHALLVWHNNVTWRLNSDFYAPSPDATKFTIAGQSFVLNDGVVGLALSPARDLFRSKTLFFSSLSSFNLNSVSVRDLHRSKSSPVTYSTSSYKFPSQCAAIASTSSGILFFGSVSEMSLRCWNTNRQVNANNVVTVAQDDHTLQFASGVKVKKQPTIIPHVEKEYVWVSTNRIQKFMTGTRNLNETNFWIQKASVRRLIAGTRCYG